MDAAAADPPAIPERVRDGEAPWRLVPVLFLAAPPLLPFAAERGLLAEARRGAFRAPAAVRLLAVARRAVFRVLAEERLRADVFFRALVLLAPRALPRALPRRDEPRERPFAAPFEEPRLPLPPPPLLRV